MRFFLFFALLLLPGVALADGAFPDEMAVLAPPSAPHRLIVATNFGLVISEDDGMHWRFTCERLVSGGASNALVSLYQVGPDSALYGIYTRGMARSADGCTWSPAGGTLSGRFVFDAFVDPNDAQRVVAIGSADSDATALYPSQDGALTFAAPLMTDPDSLKSVEISRSVPGLLYATSFHLDKTGAGTSFLLRSVDSGVHWSRQAITAVPGSIVRIAAIDPDRDRIYLRLTDALAGKDAIGISDDGGQTITLALQIDDFFTAFLRASDGTLYAGTRASSLYVRAPGAGTFEKRAAPHLRCLGERAGHLFACGDNALDGFALGQSDDGGKTLKPLFRFQNICGMAECEAVQATCVDDWDKLRKSFKIADDVSCTQASDGGSADAGLDGGLNVGAPPPKGGCHCGSAPMDWAMIGFLLLVSRRRRR